MGKWHPCDEPPRPPCLVLVAVGLGPQIAFQRFGQFLKRGVGLRNLGVGPGHPFVLLDGAALRSSLQGSRDRLILGRHGERLLDCGEPVPAASSRSVIRARAAVTRSRSPSIERNHSSCVRTCSSRDITLPPRAYRRPAAGDEASRPECPFGEPAWVLRETVLMPLFRPRHGEVRAVGVPGRTPATASKVELRLRRSAALAAFPRPARWRRPRARPTAERRGRAGA